MARKPPIGPKAPDEPPAAPIASQAQIFGVPNLIVQLKNYQLLLKEKNYSSESFKGLDKLITRLPEMKDPKEAEKEGEKVLKELKREYDRILSEEEKLQALYREEDEKKMGETKSGLKKEAASKSVATTKSVASSKSVVASKPVARSTGVDAKYTTYTALPKAPQMAQGIGEKKLPEPAQKSSSAFKIPDAPKPPKPDSIYLQNELVKKKLDELQSVMIQFLNIPETKDIVEKTYTDRAQQISSEFEKLKKEANDPSMSTRIWEQRINGTIQKWNNDFNTLQEWRAKRASSKAPNVNPNLNTERGGKLDSEINGKFAMLFDLEQQMNAIPKPNDHPDAKKRIEDALKQIKQEIEHYSKKFENSKMDKKELTQKLSQRIKDWDNWIKGTNTWLSERTKPTPPIKSPKR